MAKSKRKLVNYLKTSGLTRTYYLHVFAGGVAFCGIVMVYIMRQLSEILMWIATLPDMEMAAMMNDRLLTVAVLFFVTFFGFMVCTVFYMIVLGQRVGGPVVAICNYIQALKVGDYGQPRSLRKNDELTAIMNELNELAEVLKQKDLNGQRG